MQVWWLKSFNGLDGPFDQKRARIEGIPFDLHVKYYKQACLQRDDFHHRRITSFKQAVGIISTLQEFIQDASWRMEKKWLELSTEEGGHIFIQRYGTWDEIFILIFIMVNYQVAPLPFNRMQIVTPKASNKQSLPKRYDWGRSSNVLDSKNAAKMRWSWLCGWKFHLQMSYFTSSSFSNRTQQCPNGMIWWSIENLLQKSSLKS